MANWEVTKTTRHGKPIEEHTAKVRGGSYKIEADVGSQYGVLYWWDDLRGFGRIESGTIAALKRKAETMPAKDARGLAGLERIANMSSPGAKDTMASEKESFQKEYILWALPKGETDRLHERPIVEGIQTPQQMDDAKRKAAAQGWHGFRVQILDMSKPFRWMSRPGAKATFKVEDCFYFGKGRKDRFASALQWTSDNDSSVSEWSDLLFTAKKKFDLMEDSARAARLEIRRVALLFDRAKAQKNPAMLADAIKHGNALKRALPI